MVTHIKDNYYITNIMAKVHSLTQPSKQSNKVNIKMVNYMVWVV
jgi:hypothetical protein